MDAESGKVIADMSGENKRQIVLRGGRGGKGNQHYATATMQVPKYAQPGQPAQELEVLLELKVIADVGLVGFPNVGKSTFLSRVTNAQPKIANYHFTTLSPNLGVVDTENGGFVIADIPGLIEGASEGVGLGHEFLRHIERTRVIIHIVDAASTEGRDPIDDIYKINKELEAYNPEIAARPQVIAANKIDCIYTEDGEESPIDKLKAEFEPKGIQVYPISAVSGQGVRELLFHVKELLDSCPQEPVVFEQEFFPEDELFTENLPFTVERHPEDPDIFVVEGPKIEKMLGYNNTKVIETIVKQAPGSEYINIGSLQGYRDNCLLPEMTTNWFIPSIQELAILYKNNDIVNQKLEIMQQKEMDFVLNDKQLGYWSSTEFNNQMMYAYNSKVTEKSIKEARAYKSTRTAYLRFTFAF